MSLINPLSINKNSNPSFIDIYEPKNTDLSKNNSDSIANTQSNQIKTTAVNSIFSKVAEPSKSLTNVDKKTQGTFQNIAWLEDMKEHDFANKFATKEDDLANYDGRLLLSNKIKYTANF